MHGQGLNQACSEGGKERGSVVAARRRGGGRRGWAGAVLLLVAAACMILGAVMMHERRGEGLGLQGMGEAAWEGDGKATELAGREAGGIPLLESLLWSRPHGAGLALGRVGSDFEGVGAKSTRMMTMLAGGANETATEKVMRDFVKADAMASLPDDLEAYRYDKKCNGTKDGSYALNVTESELGSDTNRTYTIVCEMGDGTNTTFDITVHTVIPALRKHEKNKGIETEVIAPLNGTDALNSSSAVKATNRTEEGTEREAPSAEVVGHRGNAGWNKSRWNMGDWATWIIMGPVISSLFCGFIFFTFGAPAGVACLGICAALDVLTFYFNW